MQRNSHRLGFIVCVVVLLGLTSAATVSAQRNTKTLTAWGKIKIKYGAAGTLPSGLVDDVTISLKSTSQSNTRYEAVINSGSNTIANAFRTGKFEFRGVPAEGQPMSFSLCFTPINTGRKCLNGIYSFYYPGFPATGPRVEKAGYMGEFTLDVVSGKISSR